MKIAIIGAGAMGSLFGARLSQAGHEVWLLDLWREHVDVINRDGLTVITGEGRLTARPLATTDAAAIGQAGLVIVFVKAGNTAAAAQTALSLLGPETAVLTLQNGYGNAEELAEVLDPARIIAGTTAQGATILGPGLIRHGGDGETHIGDFAGGVTERVTRLAKALTVAGIPALAEADVKSLIWGKLIINAGINALTGITGLQNGRLLQFPQTKQLMELLVLEAVAVAAATGVDLPYDKPVEKVAAVAAATAQNRSSMLQDLDNARLTEIDAINGAIVRMGAKAGVPTPVNETLMLLIKTLEKIKQTE